MKVASLELCKELFELSGWEDAAQVWKYTEPMSTDIKYGLREDGDKHCYSIQKGPMKAWNPKEASVWPAYDLGFLLRKLPALDAQGYIRLTKMNPEYHALYTINDKDHIAGAFADTPEDAVTLLAIELFKQGVL